MKEIVKSIKKQKGITLVALVITIIVLILLAVVSINIMKNTGLIEKAELAKEEHRASAIQEQLDLLKNEQEIAKQNNETEPSINELINRLQEQKLITEEEKNTIMQTGKITIASKEIIFSRDAILPQGYTRCKYLESTGTQYINTNFKPNNNTSIEIKVTVQNSINTCLYCSRTNLSQITYSAFLMQGTNLRIDYGNQQNLTNHESLIGKEYVYRQEKNEIYVNGELIATIKEKNFQCAYNMYLLASHIGEINIDNCRNSILYYCKIWDNNILVRNFIPCLDSNNRPCMYDTVSGQTFYNQGTGEFIAGPTLT